jgi:hypothetical protein
MRKPSYIDHRIFRAVGGFCDLLYLLQFVVCLLQAWQRGAHLHVVALLACPSLILGFAAYKTAQRRFGWPSLRETVRARIVAPFLSRAGNKLLNPRLLVLWSLMPVICDEAWAASRTRER